MTLRHYIGVMTKAANTQESPMTRTEINQKLKETTQVEGGVLFWTWNRDGTRLVRVFIPNS